MLKGSPKISAITKVPTPCNNIIGINEIMYPNMYSIGFIGLIPSLINNDVFLSFAMSVDANSVINEKLNISTPGVKFSSLYASFGILNC